MKKKFVNRLHLVLHACVEIFDVTFFLRLRGLWGGKTGPQRKVGVHNFSISTDNNATTVGQGGMVERLRTVKEVMIQ